MTLPEPSSLQDLLSPGWAQAQAEEHPLGRLQGRPLGKATLIVLLGPHSRYGARYFQVFLRNWKGAVSQGPVLMGLYASGPYPASNWIEVVALWPRVQFPGSGPCPDITIDGLAQTLFGHLAELIPPGGHLTVEYDSPLQGETAGGLAQGVPAAATPLGYLLFSVGCGASFKDWYFAEGGSEGPRKLQGNKALDAEHARRQAQEMARQLGAFLEKTGAGPPLELLSRARQRAERVLAELARRHPVQTEAGL